MPQQIITGTLSGTAHIDGREVTFRFTIEAQTPHLPATGHTDYAPQLAHDRDVLNRFYGAAVATIQAAYQVTEQ
jgi:hypothetical protein